MSVPRAQSHTLTTLQDGRVLAVGGVTTADGSATPVAEVYDPATGMWTATGSSLRKRSRHIAALLSDGRVLVAGGISGGGATATAELYDPASGTFSEAAGMVHPRYNFDADTLHDGRVLVTGGGATAAPWTERSAEVYDPSSGAWTEVAKMANQRYIHRASTLADGRVLVTGGAASSHCTVRDTAEVFDPAGGGWTTVASMPEAHSTHVQEALPGGGAVVAGGWSLPQRGCGSDGRLRNSTSASIRFEPLTGTWTPTGPLNVARAASASIALADGRVLAAGGAEGGEDANLRLTSAEVFDPALGGWTPTAAMDVDRTGARAALLDDGRVLVAGGNSYSGLQSTAEIYTP